MTPHSMRLPLKTLSLLAALLCLLTACSALHRRGQPRPGAAASRLKPVPPKPGEPINPEGLIGYFELQSSNLWRQARLNTNLLKQPLPASCALRTAPAPARALAPEEMAGAVESGVVVIGGIVSIRGVPQLSLTATGFFLTESGALATCWHVVDTLGHAGLTVLTRDGQVFPVSKVLAVNTNSDLAILQVEGRGFTPLPVAATTPPTGSPVWVLGHPFPWYYMLTSGIVSGDYSIGQGPSELRFLSITADFANGSSGSPVLNQSGAVVAVAKFRHDAGIPGTPHMFAKGCVPSSLLLNMIKPE